MHLDQLGLRAAVAVAVAEGPGDRVVALTEGPGDIGQAGDRAFAGIGRRRRRRQGGRTLGNHIGQGSRVGHGRGGVMHLDQLGLRAAVAVAVAEGPGDGVVALTERTGDIGHAGDRAFAGIGRRRRRRQGGRALGNHIGQRSRVGGGRGGVMHLDQLGLRAAVAVAVAEGPGDRVIALAEGPGDIGHAGRVAEHWTITSGNEAALPTGAVVSCTLTNWDCVLLLPWLSLKVQVILCSPPLKGPVTSATPVIGPSQASVAVGAAGRVAEHWAITSGNEAALAAGAVVSCTLTNWDCVLLLPWLSLKVQVIV